MKNIKTFGEYSKVYEIFGGLFGKGKKETPKNWKDIFGFVKSEFEKVKRGDKKIKFDANEMSGFSRIYCHQLDKYGISLLFDEKTIINKSFIGDKDFDEEFPISKEEYSELKSFLDEVDSWLDEESDKKFGKSGTSVDSSGNIDFDFSEYDIEIEELNNKLKKSVFSRYLGKSYEFEISYHVLGGGKPEFMQERSKLKIMDIYLEIAMDGSCFLDIKVDFNGKECNIYFPSLKNPTSYVELKPNSIKDERVLTMDPIKKEMTRRETKMVKTPDVVFYNVVPSKYDTIQFLGELKEVMDQFDNKLRDNKSKVDVEKPKDSGISSMERIHNFMIRWNDLVEKTKDKAEIFYKADDIFSDFNLTKADVTKMLGANLTDKQLVEFLNKKIK